MAKSTPPIVNDCSEIPQGGKIKVRKVTSASIRKRFLAEGKEILRRKGTMMQYSDEAVDRFIVRAKEAGVSFSDTEVFRA